MFCEYPGIYIRFVCDRQALFRLIARDKEPPRVWYVCELCKRHYKPENWSMETL